MADSKKIPNVVQYTTEDGKVAYGATDSKGVLDAEKAKTASRSKTADKDASAAKKA